MSSKNYIIGIDNYNKRVKTTDHYIINIEQIEKVDNRYNRYNRYNQYNYNPVDNLLKFLGLYKHKCTSCKAGNCIVQGTR